MKDRKNRKKVLAVLDGERRRDRATSRVLSVSEFGLVILTRKRVRESLSKTLCETCPECGGAGRVKSVPTILTEIYDEIRKLPAELKTQKLTLRAAPAVADVLLEERDSGFLSSISSLLSEPLGVEADPLLSQEQFDILTGPPTV
jgi:ribonuclease G